MKHNLQKNWWVLTLNGLLAILFGALSLFATEPMLLSISMYFGLLVLIGGILLMIGAWDRQRKQRDYSLMLTEGIVSMILGILIMVFPGQTLRLFFIFIGIWALLMGLFKIYVAIVLYSMREYRIMLLLGGVLLFAVGLLLLLDPQFVAGIILKVVGAIFILLGMLLVYFSFVLKNAALDG
jgi:uncharacterized membrane protein HdeD (DUF308 family)